jgi:carboxymethylenebutenolidase
LRLDRGAGPRIYNAVFTKEEGEMGRMLKLSPAPGVEIAAYRADPQGKPRGGLVVIQEIFGVNSHIRNVCDGYAADGYLAIAPALFDRIEPGVDIGYTPPDIARGRDLKGRANAEHALQDIAAARDVAAEAGKVGVVGYCWGGYLAWLAAARVPGFACAICYYGGGMHDAIDEKPKVPVLAHFGEKDSMIPVEGVKRLAAAHAATAEVHIYPADHGFNCDHRGSYHAESAKLARERSLAFLRKHVG